MRRFPGALFVVAVFLSAAPALSAQDTQSGRSHPQTVASVPRLIRITGSLTPASGRALAQVETITLRLYAQEASDTVLWEETQHVMPDADGRYSVLLGSTRPDGLPLEVFQSSEPRWVGTTIEGIGEKEGPRLRFVSVPYALRASDAETLGGVPASAFVRSDDSRTSAAAAASVDAPAVILPGVPDALGKYSGTEDIVPSSLFEVGGRLGYNTPLPRDALHVQFTNTSGGMTGLAVQNLGNTSTSFSGMLFYDQNNVLGQFQGFNNVTHEYRINNIARNGSAQFDGSINFMVGSTSRFLISSAGNVGLSTTPTHRLTLGGETVQFPAALRILPTTHATSERAELQLDAWSLLQDLSGNGTKDFAIYDSAAARQRLTITPFGNVGIGTTSPIANLEVSNALSTSTVGNVYATTFNNTTSGSEFIGRKVRGTAGAPAPVVGADVLAAFAGTGRGTTNIGPPTGQIIIRAAETWTDAARGTWMHFGTTAIGSSAQGTRMLISPEGNVGIGTGFTFPEAALEVARVGQDSGVLVTAYDGEPFVLTQAAGGTPAAPLAVTLGHELGFFAATGFNGTDFNEPSAGFGVMAAENWTTTANGSNMIFAATPLGAEEPSIYMSLRSNGFVGIGTPQDSEGVPTALDRLQVFGDIRVGTTGSNGCIKSFDGNALSGTCASDGRFKKNVTSFAAMLKAVSSLRPVHYDWRTDEFPDRHFSANRSYGLIAQEVEQVLPELVVTSRDGYKGVDYTKLPLLAIQAIKELSSEKDALQARLDALANANDGLSIRVAELERLMNALLTKR
jgi:hypothetical protein